MFFYKTNEVFHLDIGKLESNWNPIGNWNDQNIKMSFSIEKKHYYELL